MRRAFFAALAAMFLSAAAAPAFAVGENSGCSCAGQSENSGAGKSHP
jgi:hypothetical protein